MKYRFMINAFDGEGGTAAAGADAGSTGAISQAAVGNEANTQVDAAPVTDMSFDEYRKAHKDEVTQWFNKEFGARHRDYADIKARVDASSGIMEVLASKYGLDPTDLKGLTEAVQNDDVMYEDKAIEAGMSIDQYKRLSQAEAENRRLLAERRAAEEQQTAIRRMEEWERQSNNLKAIFPGFDLEAESQNPEFIAMLKSGMPMERAYYALHGEEIISGAMQYTAQAVRQATADDLATRRTRPRENGLSSQASAKVSKDVHNLTKKERAEMAARSMRESIRF